MSVLLICALLALSAMSQTGPGRVLLADAGETAGDTVDASAAGEGAGDTAGASAAGDTADASAADTADASAAGEGAGDTADASAAGDVAGESEGEGSGDLMKEAGKVDAEEDKKTVATNAGEGLSPAEQNSNVDDTQEDDEDTDSETEKAVLAATKKSGFKESSKDKEALKEINEEIEKVAKQRLDLKRKFDLKHAKLHDLYKRKKLMGGVMSAKALDFMANQEKEEVANKKTVDEQLTICYGHLKDIKAKVEAHSKRLFDGVPMGDDDESEVSGLNLELPTLKLVGASASPAEGANLVFYGALATLLVASAGMCKYYNDRQKARTYHAFDDAMLEF